MCDTSKSDSHNGTRLEHYAWYRPVISLQPSNFNIVFKKISEFLFKNKSKLNADYFTTSSGITGKNSLFVYLYKESPCTTELRTHGSSTISKCHTKIIISHYLTIKAVDTAFEILLKIILIPNDPDYCSSPKCNH